MVEPVSSRTAAESFGGHHLEGGAAQRSDTTLYSGPARGARAVTVTHAKPQHQMDCRARGSPPVRRLVRSRCSAARPSPTTIRRCSGGLPDLIKYPDSNGLQLEIALPAHVVPCPLYAISGKLSLGQVELEGGASRPVDEHL